MSSNAKASRRLPESIQCTIHRTRVDALPLAVNGCFPESQLRPRNCRSSRRSRLSGRSSGLGVRPTATFMRAANSSQRALLAGVSSYGRAASLAGPRRSGTAATTHSNTTAPQVRVMVSPGLTPCEEMCIRDRCPTDGVAHADPAGSAGVEVGASARAGCSRRAYEP